MGKIADDLRGQTDFTQDREAVMMMRDLVDRLTRRHPRAAAKLDKVAEMVIRANELRIEGAELAECRLSPL